MSPKIRFFEKKRGGRRTGSRFAGTVVEALFYLGLLIAGCGLLVWILVRQIYPHWGANRYYLETRATVLDRRIVEQGLADARTYRPDIHVAYSVDGAEYRTWTYGATRVAFAERALADEALERFPLRSECPVYYDPMEPTRAVLVRDVATRRDAEWPAGIAVFEAARLAEVIGAANRYGPETLVLAGADLADLRVSGRFRVNDPRLLAPRLARMFGLHVAAERGVIRLVRA